MATYTPNFNLYQPDATDPIEDFRSEFNTNMGIIDNNLGSGGGSGGHTIYDENGSAMTQRTGLEFKGNVQVTDDSVNNKTIVDILGGGANYGFAIDENNKLFEGTINNFNQSLSYTATEDGIALCWYKGSSGTWQFLSVNDTFIRLGGNGTEQPVSYAIPIRKGDTVSARYRSESESCYFWLSVYGIKQGTNGIFAPVIYSNTERVIGVWRDGKPLYQITYSGLSLVCTNANQSYPTNADWGDIEEVVHSDIIDQYGQSCAGSVVYTGIPAKIAVYMQMANRTVTDITIQYTKTTDTAGSGDWTTDGTPAIHYSTTEKVIGTWIDGSTIYECVYDLGSDLSIPNNSWTYAVSIPNIDKIIDCRGQYSGGSFYPLMAYHSGNDVNVLAARLNAPAAARYLILQYTKSV